ncbi:MAG: endonuclease III domain-containing protein [Bacteroidia bacterium]
MANSERNWAEAVKPLLGKYKEKKHPLAYRTRFELLVMVILSARDSDKHINEIAPKLFAVYPDMKALSKASEEDLLRHLSGIVNFGNKAQWLMKLAQMVLTDENIPTTLEGLTRLPGIGRKSANVILRESRLKAEGIIVDLHVLRVAPRLGIATGTNPEKIEKQLMARIPKKDWGEIGMAISFLGREICRPTSPKCGECVMNESCEYYLGQR